MGVPEHPISGLKIRVSVVRLRPSARCGFWGVSTKVAKFLQFGMPIVSPPTFRIFADDSVVGHIAVYGLIGNMSGLLPFCAQILAEEKARYGIDPAIPLHCKEIYSAPARKDGPWARMTYADVVEFLSTITRRLAESVRPLVSLGYVDLNSMPKQLDVSADFSTSHTVKISLPFEKDRKKQALAFAFGAGVAPFANGCGVPIEECLITIAGDRTKIQWLNSARQAHYAAASWAHGFQTEISQSDVMTELADLIAYSGGQILAATQKGQESRKILRALQPRIWRCEFLPDLWNLQPTNYPENRRVISRVEDVTLEISL